MTEVWSHGHPTQIVFGTGSLSTLRTLGLGRCLIVCSRGATKRGLADRVASLLADSHIYDGASSNPTIDDIDSAREALRNVSPAAIIGIGGGSSIDVGKVLSLALADERINIGSLIDPDHPWRSTTPLPYVAIPTTAGTGAEVTPFATVWEGHGGAKHSIASPKLFPRVAIVDPDLSASLPWQVRLSTGLDALSQCFESIVNRNATPISVPLAEAGLREIGPALRTLDVHPDDSHARSSMSVAATLSGLAISQTRTGLAHSISYPLTSQLGVPHGLACAFSLPSVIAYNAAADDGRLLRVARLLQLTGVSDLGPWLDQLYADLGVWVALRTWIPSANVLERLGASMNSPERAGTNMREVNSAAIDWIVHESMSKVLAAS